MLTTKNKENRIYTSQEIFLTKFLPKGAKIEKKLIRDSSLFIKVRSVTLKYEYDCKCHRYSDSDLIWLGVFQNPKC